MDHTKVSRQFGRFSALAMFVCGVAYAIVLVAGLVSLKSPQDPIRDPYFTMMEILILISAPLMVGVLVAVHAYAARDVKAFSLTALAFMIVSAGLTSSIHFVVLVASRQVAFSSVSWVPLFLSFNTWPSVVYILDILAWDWFYGLSMLFGALVFKGGRVEKAARLAMAVSGVLSIAGMICLPLGNIQLRMIGIIGYAGLAPVVFLLLAIILGRAESRTQDTARRLDFQSGPINGSETLREAAKQYSIKGTHTV